MIQKSSVSLLLGLGFLRFILKYIVHLRVFSNDCQIAFQMQGPEAVSLSRVAIIFLFKTVFVYLFIIKAFDMVSVSQRKMFQRHKYFGKSYAKKLPGPVRNKSFSSIAEKIIGQFQKTDTLFCRNQLYIMEGSKGTICHLVKVKF